MGENGNRFGWTVPISLCIDFYLLDHQIVVLDVVDLVLMFNFNVFWLFLLKLIHLLFVDLVWEIYTGLIPPLKSFRPQVVKIESYLFTH